MEEFQLSSEVREKIDHWLTKYPKEGKRSVVVPALLFVQEQNNGWLSESAMDALAKYLDIPKIEVYEVATFYDLYELKPVGKHRISICTNVSCMLRGADEIVDSLEKHLGVRLGETTPDGKFTLRRSECLAACGVAPMCQIDNKHYHENLTPQKMLQIVDQLAQES